MMYGTTSLGGNTAAVIRPDQPPVRFMGSELDSRFQNILEYLKSLIFHAGRSLLEAGQRALVIDLSE